MTIQHLENVGIVVDDLEAVTAFFVDLGFEVQGEGMVEGDWVDGVVGLDGVLTHFRMLQIPHGHGKLELMKFRNPPAQGGGYAPPNTLGIRRIAFVVDDIDAAVAKLPAHGAAPLRNVERFEDMFRMCYVRGPEGIIVMLAERLG